MYYFSIDTITKAYSELQDKIPSKFVGLLSIFKNINSNNLQANMTYKISSAQIGNCLNDIMYLKDEDNIVSNSFLYVRFSLEWDDYVEENMFANKVNIYPFLVFLYKFVPFEEQPSVEVLIQKFASEYHISILSILKWFYKGDFNVVFASECVKRTELKEKLKIQYSTLTFDSSYSVKAKASELSRAPFIQTLYAGMDSVKCLLISKINLDALYPALNVLNKNIKEDCFPRQQIFYGAPGTGKSFTINQEIKGEDVIRTTFHPDSDYSSFVGAYKPTTREITMRDLSGHPVVEHGQTLTEEKIVYEFVPQAFLQAYIAAWEKYAACDEGNPQRQFLVIEEINRGNCAQIFGDLFQLLDRNHSGFSDYPVKADTDMKRYVAKALKGLTIPQASAINSLYGGRDVVSEVLEGNILLLPSNLFIWATMNTSDQSLFPIDSAFKRRWDWSYMPISDAKKGYVIDVAGSLYDWWQFLEEINKKIESTTNSEDKKLGYFFCKAHGGVISAETFVGKVVFYLWNDVFKDFDLVGPIFDDTVEGGKLTFAKFYTEGEMKTKVRAGKVAQFLGNLGLTPLEESEEEYNGQAESTDDSENPRATWSVSERKRYDFWEAFLAYAQKNDDFKTYFGGTKKAGKDHWKNFYVSGADFYISVVLKLWERAIALQVYFDRTTDTYYHLADQKKDIEAEMDTTYEWRENPEKKSSTIVERIDDIDFEDKEHWTTIFDLIITRILRMREVFVKYSKLQ